MKLIFSTVSPHNKNKTFCVTFQLIVGIMVADINSIRCNPKGNGEGNWQLQKLVPHPDHRRNCPSKLFCFCIGFLTNQMCLYISSKD